MVNDDDDDDDCCNMASATTTTTLAVVAGYADDKYLDKGSDVKVSFLGKKKVRKEVGLRPS